MKKTMTILYFLAALCFYIVYAIKTVSYDSSAAIVWLCLGTVFLTHGAGKIKQEKNSNNKGYDKNEKY